MAASRRPQLHMKAGFLGARPACGPAATAAPLLADGRAAKLGAVGRWLGGDDLVAAEAGAAADLHACAFPRNWPAAFKERALKSLVKRLGGQRCRAVDPPSAAVAASARCVTLHALHGFANATAVSEVLGWSVVKGFLVLERSDAAPGSYVALRHWWNATADGAWVDLTPRLAPSAAEPRSLLVESGLGDKPEAALTADGRDAFVALGSRRRPERPPSPASPAEPTGRPASPSAAEREEAEEATLRGEVEALVQREMADGSGAKALQLAAAGATTAAEAKAAIEAAAKEHAKGLVAKLQPELARRHEAQKKASLTRSVEKIERLGKGMKGVPVDEVGAMGAAADKEQARVDEHAEEVRRARERISRGVATDKFQAVADAFTVEEEEPPRAPVQATLREMLGGGDETGKRRDAAAADAADGADGADGPKRVAQWVEREGALPALQGAPPPAAPAPVAVDESEVARRVAEAEACKAEGNAAFVRGDDAEALESYHEALRRLGVGAGSEPRATGGGDEAGAADGAADERAAAALVEAVRRRAGGLLPALHSNCAAAHLRAGRHELARRAASAALTLAPKDVKARRRRAAAHGALGKHVAACDDLAAACKAQPRATKDVVRELADAWAARAPEMAPLVRRAAEVDGGTHALCGALLAEGRARGWATAGAPAEHLACAAAGTLVDAALGRAERADPVGAGALLRAAGWIAGVTGTREAEEALLGRLHGRFDALGEHADERVVVGALELVEALAMRRVANCTSLPHDEIYILWRESRSPVIRRAAESAMVWLCRDQRARYGVMSLSQAQLEPFLMRCVGAYKTCGLDKAGAGDAEANEKETGVCLGDAGSGSGSG